MRMELSNVKESVAEKINIWCVKNKKTKGQWAEIAHNSLVNKT